MKSQLTQIWQKFRFNKLNIILFFSLVLVVLLSIVYFKNDTNYIKFEDYQKLVESNLIEKANIDGDTLQIVYNGRKYSILKDIVDLKELGNHVLITKSESSDTSYLIFELILITFFFFLMIYYFETINAKRRKLEMAKMEKIQSQMMKNNETAVINSVISEVKFKDVAGISEVKDELIEIVDFLKNPSKYKNFGIKLPKGILMAGPPGVGKTLIAKAVAGEAGVPFFYQSGATFAEVYVGVGAKRVRELFAKAKANAPSIIFIDEIDAVGKSRGEGRNDERETTLNQLLTEMDGFEDNSGVIVIAATNKIDMIDEALLRSGRFDRRIFISLPNYHDRIEILKIYLKDKKCDVNLEKISRMSVGFSGAGIATLVNEAAINALKRKSKTIEQIDFENVITKVLFGSKKSQILSEYEKEIQSFYQGAKALSAFWFSLDFDRIGLLEDKIIGFEAEIESKTQILNQIKVLLSGVAALKIHKNDTFTNGSEDIKYATYQAQKMVFEYAMGDSFIPNGENVTKILYECFDEVSEILRNSQSKLTQISKQIFVYEYIDYEKVKEIFTNEIENQKESDE
ncbi:MAG: AAA family ATPase [Campylobacter sp.]|nr:AAA family ATPase [Campylobacter sp.]